MNFALQSISAACRFLVVNWLLAFVASPCLAQTTAATPASSTGSVRSVSIAAQEWRKVSNEALLKAAESGNAEAQYFYGTREWNAAREDNDSEWLHRATFGVEFTDVHAKASEEKWANTDEATLRKAAEANDRSAQWALGKRDTERASERGRKAFGWMMKAAEQSLPYAEFAVAVRYFGGWMVIPTDFDAALKWLHRSADHGYEPAVHRLANLLLAGKDIPPDPVKGIDYLRAAADADCPTAEFELARRYASGEGEPRHDGETPVALLQKALRHSHTPSLAALADRYRIGFGVKRDLIRAIRLYEAAEKAQKQASLHQDIGNPYEPPGVLNLVGPDLEPVANIFPEYMKFAEVLSAYRKATLRSDAAAMTKLGELCLGGSLTAQSKVNAYRWFSRAADHGYSPALKARNELRPHLSVDEIAAATQPEEVLEQYGPRGN